MIPPGMPSRESLVWLVGGALAIALGAQISVTMWPVPTTLQTLAVVAVGLRQGPVVGAGAAGLYLGTGSPGAPRTVRRPDRAPVLILRIPLRRLRGGVHSRRRSSRMALAGPDCARHHGLPASHRRWTRRAWGGVCRGCARARMVGGPHRGGGTRVSAVCVWCARQERGGSCLPSVPVLAPLMENNPSLRNGRATLAPDHATRGVRRTSTASASVGFP